METQNAFVWGRKIVYLILITNKCLNCKLKYDNLNFMQVGYRESL